MADLDKYAADFERDGFVMMDNALTEQQLAMLTADFGMLPIRNFLEADASVTHLLTF